MEDIERYNHLNEYLKKKFGERTLKICIDGGFTCPNRDGKVGYGGCIYCSERGSGELINKTNCNAQYNTGSNTKSNIGSNTKYNIKSNTESNTGNAIKNTRENLKIISDCESIKNQVEQYFKSYRAERANKFIAYFQNFTNTYDTIENLKKKYDSALIDNRIVGLEIGTRPDCINEDIAKLLKSYTDKYYVCVELGLQTSNDEIGKTINRGYTSKQFTKAVEILNKYNIDVVAHIMVGLPNETIQDIENTVNFINSHTLQGVKIHCTYVVENTVLAKMYREGKYKPLDLDDYIETLIDIMTHLKPELVIHRITGDASKDILVAPNWNKHKMWILHGFEKRFRGRNLWQGKFWDGSKNPEFRDR